MKPAAYYPALDGLRGIAVLSVVAFHLGVPLFSLGWTGVTLFFALSGFLISGILMDSRTSQNYFTTFYARRALRILPLYYGTLVVVMFVIPLLVPNAEVPPPHDRLFYFFYLNNCTSLLQVPNNSQYLGHFWTLAIEEQFYLVWPMIVFLVRPARLKWAMMLIASCGLISWLYLLNFGATPESGRLTFAAFPSLMAGACCAMFIRQPKALNGLESGKKIYLPLAVVCFSLFAAIKLGSGPWLEKSSHASALFLAGCAMVLSFTALLLAALFGPKAVKEFLTFHPLRVVGRYSYGMYVFHIPLITAFTHFYHPTSLVGRCLWRVLVLIAIFSIAALSYELFEKRLLRFKTRFSLAAPHLIRLADVPNQNT
jgi:peptidoglycan/LPS O-acetylase OafA/YrhL